VGGQMTEYLLEDGQNRSLVPAIPVWDLTEQQTHLQIMAMNYPGNTKGGSITVLLTSCLTGLDYSVLQIKTKIVCSHTADSKPVKQEVNDTVILPPLVFPELAIP
jgi:hypothetical protein